MPPAFETGAASVGALDHQVLLDSFARYDLLRTHDAVEDTAFAFAPEDALAWPAFRMPSHGFGQSLLDIPGGFVISLCDGPLGGLPQSLDDFLVVVDDLQLRARQISIPWLVAELCSDAWQPSQPPPVRKRLRTRTGSSSFRRNGASTPLTDVLRRCPWVAMPRAALSEPMVPIHQARGLVAAA